MRLQLQQEENWFVTNQDDDGGQPKKGQTPTSCHPIRTELGPFQGNEKGDG